MSHIRMVKARSLIENKPFSNKIEMEANDYIAHASMIPLKYDNVWMLQNLKKDMNRHKACRR